MKYFIIGFPVEKKIIGKHPQGFLKTSSLEFKNLYMKMEFTWQKYEEWSGIFKNYELEIKVSPATKLTSFLHIYNVGRDLIVDENVLDFLKKNVLPNWVTASIKIYVQNKYLENSKYHWLNIEAMPHSFIDFDKSIFKQVKFLGSEFLDEFKLINSESLIPFIKKQINDMNTYILPKDLFLKREFNYDLFRFDFFENGQYFVSERLMNKMQKAWFTGIEFKEPKDFKIIKL